MKSLVRVLGFSFVILFMVLMVGKAGTKPPGAPDPSTGPVIIFDPPLSDWVSNKAGWDVKVYIKEFTDKLIKPIKNFKPGEALTPDAIPLIAAVYGPNGNFTGHDGLTYKGICEISMYFYRLITHHKITDFNIQIKVVYAKEFTDRVKNDKGLDRDHDVLHSFYFILASSFKLDDVPVDPPGSTNCPHIRMCECNNGI